ncbi:MAG: type IV pilin, partial [Methanomassiliicoccales archaeon]|nr:type IV pilin [Methanomassiliicoccales archaeon]
MWKLNNKAVSPVIATILMVAITVVLAAVLYVMVMGFGGDNANETPSGSFTTTEKVLATEK